MSPEESRTYEAHLKAYRDNESAMATAVREGKAEGRAEGIVEGEAKGKAEGIAEVARNLKQAGLNIALIVQTTGLSENEIERL